MNTPPPYPLPPEYKYRKLKPRDAIRLLKLSVGNADANDIDCELIETGIGPDQSEPYEAISWCWGKERWDKTIRIHQDGRPFSFKISPNLYSALKAFRRPDSPRTLWIDAICIDQENPYEKNHQVPMMAQIYGKATRVCVWLGDGDDKSKLALDFIKKDVLQLWDFDKLCEDTSNAPKWDALISLMNRPWFSRRWVVQEIVLAGQAMLQCGPEYIEWQEFADAVALFVEVETATHRLSEVMKKHPEFYHIPDFFGDVRSLGATLLVEATSNLFRKTKDGKREPLLSLEYLVSSLSVFDATEPRDTIFALLAIAKDTSPKAADEYESVSASPEIQQQLIAWGKRNIAIKAYPVDYERPFIEVFKDFMVFSIRKSDQTTALDILCRPWAPLIDDIDDKIIEKLPSWIPDVHGAAFAMIDRPPAGQSMFRKNADPLVGLPNTGQRDYRAAGSRVVNLSKLKFTKRKDFYSLYVEGFVLDKVGKVEEASRAGYIPFKWLAPGGWLKMSEPPPEEFWRTLVADRGPNGRNAPSFYTRACHESFKRTIWGEPVNTRQLIDEGRCTIVAEFLRRVQAVIWNRLLMRTGKGRLGLVHETTKEGDLICILYGCSVPVVLRKFDKTDAQIKEEQVEDELELEKLKREAVDKIQAAYLARLQRIRQKKLKKGKMHPYKVKVDWKRYWNYTRHIAVVALALYLKVWDQLAPESLKLAGFVSFAILLGIFPGVLVWQARRLRLTMGRNMPTWMKRTPKTTGLCQVRRSNDCYYQLIGPCYVHGMMNGEAIQFQNDNGVHPEVFDLR
jgi:hypothetical protein